MPASTLLKRISRALRRAPVLPLRLRNIVRSHESGLTAIAACIGVTSGMSVSIMAFSVQFMHQTFFGIHPWQRLSAIPHVGPLQALGFPILGGAVLAFTGFVFGRRLKDRLFDAIEANALYGGKMSFRGSLWIGFQTIISAGFGASVGLEAGFTQVSAAFGSWFARRVEARRSDTRVLVAAGAAGAISAAFLSPLAGAAYGFEVILGGYSLSAFAPIAVSAIIGCLVAGPLTYHTEFSPIHLAHPDAAVNLGHAVVLALFCSGATIILMRGVAEAEKALAKSPLPPLIRPIFGGLGVGALALLSPQVLGAGHGALSMDVGADLSLGRVGGLIALKALAVVISLASGFRGGLFFASLLLGALLGQAYSDALALLAPQWSVDPALACMTGMAAVGSGVMGAPLTLTLLTLEMTGDLALALPAFTASVIASTALREAFGYSFATWRLHLRGETIRGPQDVGWLRDLTVATVMRTGLKIVAETLTVAETKQRAALGSTKQLVMIDANGAYAGLLLLEDLYTCSDDDNDAPISRLARFKDASLTPRQTLTEALQAFKDFEADALVVLENGALKGLVTEAYALRRYGEVLEARQTESLQG